MGRIKKVELELTKRDVEILNFINRFGFCEMPQLDKRFELKKPRNYQLINRLLKGGWITHEKIFHGRHGIYRLTPKGAKHTNLPHLKRLSLNNYRHDLTLIEVFLELNKKYPDAEFVGERQLKREKFFDGIGKFGHVADGLFIFPEKKQIALEVELKPKGRARLESILKGYSSLFEIDEVWYYCADEIVPYLRSMVENKPHIKIFGLTEILGEQKFWFK